MMQLVEPGQTVLDVGAWEGPLSFLFASLVGSSGKVYSFEPMPQSFSVLEHNAKVNNFDNIFPYQLAMSNVIGKANLTFDAPGSSGAALEDSSKLSVDGVAGKFKSSAECFLTTIDDFCLSHHVVPNGLKVDVEGAELKVFEGAVKTIERYHPWCLLEFHGHYMTNEERQQLWSFIVSRAQKITHLQGDEDRLPCNSDVPKTYTPDRAKRILFCIYF